MMHKSLVDLNLSTLKRCTPERLQQQTVTVVLLALGSNHHAEYYLRRVREQLATLGEVRLSTAFKNPDFTATSEYPKPDYTNQCVYLFLINSMTLHQLQHMFKKFEGECNRQRLTEPTVTRQVTMDIDILLITLSNADEWIIMADRYPFKAHENAGIAELTERKL